MFNIISISKITNFDKLSKFKKKGLYSFDYCALFNIKPIKHSLTSQKEIIDKTDIFIFQSKNAVMSCQSIWNDIKLNQKSACLSVGKFTSETIEKNILIKCMYPKNNYSSEGLLKIDQLKNIKGKIITVFRGKRGRDFIDNVLLKRGAVLNILEVYERVRNITKADGLKLDPTKVNYIISLSREALQDVINIIKNVINNYEIVFVLPNKRIAERINIDKKIQIIYLQKIGNIELYFEKIKEHYVQLNEKA